MKGILLNTDGDLLTRLRRDNSGIIISGLAIGNVNADIAERIINAYPGEFKEVPRIGGNIRKNLSGRFDPFWRGDVKKQLKVEHIDVKEFNITENGIELEIND